MMRHFFLGRALSSCFFKEPSTKLFLLLIWACCQSCAGLHVVEKYVVKELPKSVISEAQSLDFGKKAKIFFGQVQEPYEEIVRIEFKVYNPQKTIVLASYFIDIWDMMTSYGANALLIVSQERINEHEIRARIIGIRLKNPEPPSEPQSEPQSEPPKN